MNLHRRRMAIISDPYPVTICLLSSLVKGNVAHRPCVAGHREWPSRTEAGIEQRGEVG